MIHFLKAGDPAPNFSLPDQNGKIISLQNFTGKKLILFFYPQDDTPTCTIEACNLRDHYKKLKRMGYHLIGISPDDKKSHQKFIEKFLLPFPLLSDTEKKMACAYGVYGDKLFFGKVIQGIHRCSFLINEMGIIQYIFFPVKSKSHSEDILQVIKSLAIK